MCGAKNSGTDLNGRRETWQAAEPEAREAFGSARMAAGRAVYTAGRNEETGKLIYKSVLARTRAECKRQLREALRQRGPEAEAPPRQVLEHRAPTQQANGREFTVAQWLQTWYDLYAKQDIRRSTQNQYTYFMNSLVIPRIGELPFSQLTGLHLQTLYKELRTSGRVHPRKHTGAGLSPKTVRSVHMFLHSALEQTVDLLIQEHALHPDNPYLFPSPATGDMYSPETVARIHKRILKDAGLEDCRFHEGNHS